MTDQLTEKIYYFFSNYCNTIFLLILFSHKEVFIMQLNLPTRILMFSICSSIEYDIKKHILKCTSEIKYTEEMLKKANSRLNEKNGIENTSERILNSLDLSDYIEIIRGDPYTYKINNEKISELIGYFEKVIPIRNRVMHTKPIEIGDKATLLEVMESIDTDFKFISWEEIKNTRRLINESPEKLINKWKPIKYHDDFYHNLPEPEFDDTGYIGRKKEIKEITDLIIDARYPVISIIGNGGIGKTALTVKILYDLIENVNNPYEAIIWVSLKAKTLSNGEFVEIQNTIRSLGELINTAEKEVIIDNSKSSKDNVLEFMKNFRTLLVIDNLETINDNSINSFIKSVPRESNVLITSRTGLGELEYRYNLSGMNTVDGIQYFRELSRYYGLDLYKRENGEISKLIKETLYSNPLSIKWYITGISNGIREDILQNQKAKLVEFCMSNVYEKINEDSKDILKLFQIEDFEMTYGEIEFYIEKDEIAMKKAINELLATNMMHIKDAEYQIDTMAKDYLQLHESPDEEFIDEIAQKKKKLNDMLQDIKVKKENSIFDTNSLLYEYDNKDNKIAAIYLYRALELGKENRLEEALSLTDRASNVAPNYFECYKVKGFLNANAKNLAEAIKNYQIAIDKCNNKLEYATTYYIFSFFYTVVMPDYDTAYDLICKAEFYMKNSAEILLQKVRVMTRLGKFEEAESILKNVAADDDLSDKVKNIKASVTSNLYKKWAEVFERRDTEKKLKYLKLAINSIKKLENPDIKTYVSLMDVLKELSTMYYDSSAMTLLRDTLEENYNGVKTVKNNGFSFIRNNINNHEYEIEENVYRSIRSYLLDYRKISKNVFDSNMGIVTHFPKPNGYISNNLCESIYFNTNRTNCHDITVGDVVKFDTVRNKKGLVAYNIRKTDKKIDEFIL